MRDVKLRYLAGGSWKKSIIAKKGKASRTAAKRARVYCAVPPASGWPGGLPGENGYRRSAAR